MDADLFGVIYWESNTNKMAAGGELGSEWHIRVEDASPNARQFIGRTLEVTPVPDIRNFQDRRVAMNAQIVQAGISRHRPVVRIKGISLR